MIKVMNHGDKFSEKEELNEKYPFQICPECMSINTEITDIVGRYATTKYESKFLFDVKITKVNHKCNDCGCIFVDEYKDGRSQRKISDCLFWGVISFIASFFMLFSLVCALDCLILAEPSFLLILWVSASLILFSVFFPLFIVCLGG